ncbi:DUF2147 domain-containing protein [Vineibacter terrae]|uniref:DUF2147 domain-containing protein n=1 Tax=Vineibacter terrae TaxID=2586908 RepID=UPI002E3106E0|nr:DUF2147 domain-containing protein [Vineibacter terrae]HEX2890308.1 DUF2147 domain-containing protein [Vineibacter terrae]
MAPRSRRLEALVLAMAGIIPAMAAADEPVIGQWITDSQSARIAIAPCADDLTRLCGRIVWLAKPLGADGTPARDGRNPDPTLRGRLLVGSDILRGFRPAGSGRWSGGTIYDPESGRTYDARLRLTGADTLELKGCVLIFCDARTWHRQP